MKQTEFFQNEQLTGSDEVNLAEVWEIIVKRKKTIIGICLICMFVTGMYLFVSKPIYESRAVISVGQIGQAVNGVQAIQIENPPNLVQRLKEKYSVGDNTESSKMLPILSSVELDRRTADNIIVLKAQGNSPEDAQSFLNTAITEIIREHGELLALAKGTKQRQLDSLRQRIKDINVEVSTYSSQVLATDNVMNTLLVLEKSKLRTEQGEIEKQISDIETSIELQMKPTQIFRQPTLPAKPTRSMWLYTAFAALFGLMVGVLGALCREWISKKNNNTDKIIH